MPWLLLAVGLVGVALMRTQGDEQLSANFWLSEWATSSIAPELVQLPRGRAKARARFGATHILQPLRDVTGPTTITSGYRSRALNAVIPGSSDTSDHMTGAAVDIVVPGFTNHQLIQILWELAQAGRVSGIDQVITYRDKGHLHIGWGDRQRNQWLVHVSGSLYEPWRPA